MLNWNDTQLNGKWPAYFHKQENYFEGWLFRMSKMKYCSQISKENYEPKWKDSYLENQLHQTIFAGKKLNTFYRMYSGVEKNLRAFARFLQMNKALWQKSLMLLCSSDETVFDWQLLARQSETSDSQQRLHFLACSTKQRPQTPSPNWNSF